MPDASRVEYDELAWLYNRYMAADFSRRVQTAIERLLLQELQAGARILDVCCGTGQMARLLSDAGYRVTGLDISASMLQFARRNAPHCDFVLGDARSVLFNCSFDGVLSIFNSLAHISTADGLERVFKNVYAGLRTGGVFLFDLSMEEAYTSKWRGSFSIVEKDHACVVQLGYEPHERLGRNQITLFSARNAKKSDPVAWRRTDFTILQKCHSKSELKAALLTAGFAQLEIYDAQCDLGMEGEHGRAFFRSRKP